MVEFELERLLKDAKNDENLKSELIKTKSSENPVEDFCNTHMMLEIHQVNLFSHLLFLQLIRARAYNWVPSSG